MYLLSYSFSWISVSANPLTVGIFKFASSAILAQGFHSPSSRKSEKKRQEPRRRAMRVKNLLWLKNVFTKCLLIPGTKLTTLYAWSILFKSYNLTSRHYYYPYLQVRKASSTEGRELALLSHRAGRACNTKIHPLFYSVIQTQIPSLKTIPTRELASLASQTWTNPYLEAD